MLMLVCVCVTVCLCVCVPQPPSAEECPIYNNFDWNKPGRTIAIAVASLVGYLVVAGIYTAFVSCPQTRSTLAGVSAGKVKKIGIDRAKQH